jgi:hypothetical protein
MQPSKLTVPLLRAELERRGLETSGLKAVLVARLEGALASETGAAAAAEAAPEPAATPVVQPIEAAPAPSATLAEPEPMEIAESPVTAAPEVRPRPSLAPIGGSRLPAGEVAA